MKKTVFTFLSLILVGFGAAAQHHRCGTTEYYEMRYLNDPALQQRMAAEEAFIQQWIKDHPQQVSTADKTSFPVLTGFESTGDVSKDREAYKAAKEIYYSTHPAQKPEQKVSEQEIKADPSVHKVTMVHISNTSK
ncbi:MAG: hypothetical protein ABIO46_10290 [Chitinophagales bacterium]